MNRLLKPLLYLVFTFGTVAGYTQGITLRGKVTDANGNALPLSSVLCYPVGDSSLNWFSLSEEDGSFQLRNIRAGRLVLQILHVGFDLFEDTLELNTDRELETSILQQSNITLKEVLIKARSMPIVFKGDTMVYNTNNYTSRANATVEDLLRQLPGLRVDKDGTVVAQGEQVVKVLVNGKEFFGDDPTKATRNIQADAIEKVEVLDRKTETAAFSGIDDGTREKVINLVLKEDANKGYFGKIELGAGTNETYMGKVTLNKFNEDNQFTLIGNLNNLNQNGFNWDEYFSMLGGPTGITLGQRTYWMSQNEFIGQSEEGRQRNAVLGANGNFKAGQKGTVNSSYFFLDRNNNLITNSTSENYLPQRTIFNIGGKSLNADNGQHKWTATYRLNRDTLNFLTVQSSFSLSTGEQDDSNFSINRGEEGNLLNHTIFKSEDIKRNLNAVAKATYLRKFRHSKQVLTFESGFDRNVSSDTTKWGNLQLGVAPPIGQGVPLNLGDRVRGTGFKLYNSFSWSMPVGASANKNINLRIEHKLGTDSFGQERLLLPIDSVFLQQSPLIRSQYQSTSFTAALSRKFEKQGWHYNIRLGYLLFDLDRSMALNSEVEIFKRNPGFWMPGFFLGFRVPQKVQFGFWMHAEEVLPAIRELNPVANVVNPLSQRGGNPDLLPYVRYQSGLNYRRSNPGKQSSLYSWFNAGLNTNGILNSEIRDSNNISFTLLKNGGYSAWSGGNVGYTFPLGKTGIDVDLSTGYNYYTYRNEQNGLSFMNRQQSYDVSLDLEATLGPIELAVGYAPEYSWQNSELFDKTAYWKHYYSATALLYLGKRIEWSNELGGYVFNNSSVGGGQHVLILNSGLTWSLDSNQLWQLSLMGYDLFKKAQSIDRNLFSNGYSEIRQNTLTRYFMFNLAYTVRKGKKKEQERMRF